MKRLLTLFSVLTLALTFFSANAKTYLVAVGVADYPGTANDLRLCAKDARDIVNLYEMRPGTESLLLTDHQATKENIVRAMTSVYSKATSKDQVMFFFSGHGMKGCFVAYDGPISYNNIRAAMAKGKSKSKMIYADACFAGKFRNMPKTRHNSNDDKKADVLLFLSSRSNEKSKELRTGSNGLFTTYLLSGLKGKADYNRDRTITARELFSYVSKHVAEDSRKEQHPVMWGSFSDNMPMFRW